MSKKISEALVKDLSEYESEKRQRTKRNFFLGCLTLAVMFLALYIADLLNVWIAFAFILVMVAIYFLTSRNRQKRKKN